MPMPHMNGLRGHMALPGPPALDFPKTIVKRKHMLIADRQFFKSSDLLRQLS